MAPISLHSIGLAVGEQRPIEGLSALKGNAARLDAFRKMGFESYRFSEAPPSGLAIRAMEASLKGSPVAPGEIDVVLYCSNSLWEEDYYRNMHRAFLRLGMERAFPIGIHFTFCGNFASGIRLATSLMAAGEAGTVMVVCTDGNLSEDDPRRLLEPAVAVTSDGAVCCLLSKGTGTGYRVLGATQLVNHRMSRMDIDDIYTGGKVHSADFLMYSLESFKGRKQAAEAFMERTGRKPADFRHFITNNYGSNTLQGFASESGMRWDSLFRGTVSTNGHVQSADNLINLAALEAVSPLSSREKILMLSTGPYSWGYVGLEKA